LGDFLAIFTVALVDNHVSPIAPRCRQLGRRGVVGHHDGGVNPQLARRQRHRLRMVAGREGDHPGTPLRLAQLGDGVIGAAEFEGADALEILAFEKQLGADNMVRLTRGHHRGTNGMPGNNFGGGGNICGGDAMER
jgi:hypothetical protein